MENKITTAAEWQAALSAATTPGKADTLSRFFKTGKGEYGEGDKFIGVMVPANRQIAKQTLDAPLQTVAEMLASEIHEHRLSALLSLVERYRKARKDPRRETPDSPVLPHPYQRHQQLGSCRPQRTIYYRRPDNGRQRPNATPSRQRQPVGTTHSRRVDNAAHPQPPVRHRPPQRRPSAPTPPRPDAESQRLDAPRNGQTRHFHAVAFSRPPRSLNAPHNAALCRRTACPRAEETLYGDEKAHIQQFIKIKLQKKFRDFVAISEKIYTFAQNFKKAERRLYK